MKLLFLGTAGSGKSWLVHSFSEWLALNGLANSCANLDAGADSLFYDAEFDIRKRFTVSQLMKKERLGPNGAMIRAAELMAKDAGKIANAVAKLKKDFIIIDSPGQMEIFVFHESGEKIARAIGGCCGVFLLDAALLKQPSDIILLKLLSLSAQLRLGIPLVNIVSKSDILSKSEKEKLAKASASREEMRKSVAKAKGLDADLKEELLSAFSIAKTQRLVFTSAKKKTGMAELLDLLNETKCACGDLA